MSHFPILTLYSDSSSDDDDDLCANASSTRKRNQGNYAPKDVHSDNEMFKSPQKKKQKQMYDNQDKSKKNNAFSQIMAAKKSASKKSGSDGKKKKKKKLINKTINKLVEEKFVKHNNKTRMLLINNDIDNGNWEVIAGLAGFTETEIPILKELLSSYISDTSGVEENDHIIIFNPTPSDDLPRELKNMWNKGSMTFKMINKRLFILQLFRSTDITIKSSTYSTIINIQMKSRHKLSNIKNNLNKKSLKNKQSKLCSINETINNIKASKNKDRDMNKLCDNILVVRKILKDALNELNMIIRVIENLLVINLKLIKLINGERVHLKYRTVDGKKKLKAPKLLSIFDRLVNDVNQLKNDIIDKQSLLDDVKIENIKNRAKEAEVARKKDRVRKQNRKNKEKQNEENELNEYNYIDEMSNDDNKIIDEQMQNVDIQQSVLIDSVSKTPHGDII